MKTFDRSLALLILKRFLDLGILVYLALIPIVLVTGGFKVEILGVSVKANHLYTPIKLLVPLALIRLILTVELKNFLLLMVSLIFCLLGGELVFRVWNPPIAKPEMAQIHRASPVFDWELIPGSFGVGGFGEVYHINSAGFRDTEHKLEGQTGTSRIMVIGDSFTFGPSVNLEDTYPKQLEGILNNQGISCEVINCGVIGYDTWQYVQMLKRKVIPYQPDLVILGLFLNDINDSVAPYNRDNWKGSNPFKPEGASEIMEHSYLWNSLSNLNYWFETKYRYRRGHAYLQGIEKRRNKFGPEDTWYKIMRGTLEKEKYIEFKEALRNFVELSRSAGIRNLISIIPDAAQLHETDMQDVNRFVERTCSEIGVPFVDVTPALEKGKDPRTLYLFPHDPHNSPKGYRVIAQAIADAIHKFALLPSERPRAAK